MNHSPFLKICGITNIPDMDMICAYQPSALGFVLYDKSPRNISIEKLQELSQHIRAQDFVPLLVAVLVNPTFSLLEQISPLVDIFQLHGDETSEYISEIQEKLPNIKIWKALPIATQQDLKNIQQYENIKTFVLDAFCGTQRGGSGEKIPSYLLPQIKKYITPQQKFLIAGGINISNFSQILQQSNADGIDLSSSLEGEVKGVKEKEKVIEFFQTFST